MKVADLLESHTGLSSCPVPELRPVRGPVSGPGGGSGHRSGSAGPSASPRDIRAQRARHDVIRAVAIAASGRAAEAGRRLRSALGVLERRSLYATAARAAATLGCLLREQGDLAGARTTMERAHQLVAIARAQDPRASGPGDPPTDAPPTTYATNAEATNPEATNDRRTRAVHLDGQRSGHAEDVEDYAWATSLLTTWTGRIDGTRRLGPTAEQCGHGTGRVDELATGAAALIQVSVGHADSLSPLCRCLERLVGASVVSVHRRGLGVPCIATSGGEPPAAVTRELVGDSACAERAAAGAGGTRERSGDQLDDGISDEDPTSDGATSEDIGRIRVTPTGASLVLRVRDDGRLVGWFCVAWWNPPQRERWPVMRHLASLAATLCAPEVQVTAADEGRTVVALNGIAGRSEAIDALRLEISRAAACGYPVLIEGETGTGKELVARAIHRSGPRQSRSFLAVNCAALSDELFEAELFGHARGAFTGAVATRPGLFEEAHGGTLFLDEVGELSPRAQAKLLRVVQDGEVRRLGENAPRSVDVRLVAATNRVLSTEVEEGRFRADLLFRLGVLRLAVPPLRDRRDDIMVLAQQFWAAALRDTGGRAVLRSDTLEALAAYRWPGNVRELENVVARLAVSAPRRGWVTPAQFPPPMVGRVEVPRATLAEARRQFERRWVKAALDRAGGRPTVAARDLGISRQGLAKLLRRLGVRRGPARAS